MEEGYGYGDLDDIVLNNTSFRKSIVTIQNQFQLDVMSLKPGQKVDMEIHKNFTQFIVVEEGYGTVIRGNVIFEMFPGAFIVIPPGIQHEVANTDKTEYMKLYTVYAPPEHAEGLEEITKPSEGKQEVEVVMDWKVSEDEYNQLLFDKDTKTLGRGSYGMVLKITGNAMLKAFSKNRFIGPEIRLVLEKYHIDTFAVKVIETSNETLLKSALREFNMMNKLEDLLLTRGVTCDDINIICYYFNLSVHSSAPKMLMFMEYIRGIELEAVHAFVKDVGMTNIVSIPANKFLDIATTLLKSIRSLHSMNIFHNDIKPANIMIKMDPDSRTMSNVDVKKGLKIIDFGLAVHHDPNVVMAGTGGTPTLMSHNKIIRSLPKWFTKEEKPPKEKYTREMAVNADLWAAVISIDYMVNGNLSPVSFIRDFLSVGRQEVYFLSKIHEGYSVWKNSVVNFLKGKNISLDEYGPYDPKTGDTIEKQQARSVIDYLRNSILQNPKNESLWPSIQEILDFISKTRG